MSSKTQLRCHLLSDTFLASKAVSQPLLKAPRVIGDVQCLPCAQELYGRAVFSGLGSEGRGSCVLVLTSLVSRTGIQFMNKAHGALFVTQGRCLGQSLGEPLHVTSLFHLPGA